MFMIKYTQKSLSIFLLLSVFPLAAYAVNLTSVSVKGISQAYGFLLGQEYALTRIKKDFPELVSEVTVAQLQFNAAFPEMKSKLEGNLVQALGKQASQDLLVNLQSQLQLMIAQQVITKEIATSFLSEVKSRSKGNIESPVIEYLLAVKYEKNPSKEFSDGYRQKYQTDGLGKSQGVIVSLELPRSWAAKEGKRPHIVQKWHSENGTGTEMIMLQVRDAEGITLTKKDIDVLLNSGELKKNIPDDATYINAGKFTIETLPGYWVHYAMSMERAETNVYLESLSYQFIYKGKMILLMCQAGGDAVLEKSKVKDSFQRIQPVCKQVLNSLVLPQLY